MKSNGLKHFKDDISKTFVVYALVPVIIITLSSYFIFMSMWYRTVINQNNNINTEVSERIEGIVSAYINKASELASEENLIACINSRNIGSKIYEELYGFLNSMDIRCNFFVFDENMETLIASSENEPEYLKREGAFSWGIVRRMTDAPEQVILGRESPDGSSKQVLSLGKAIVDKGRIIGYITFDLNESDLLRIISRNFSIIVVISDKYGNIISSTNTLLINQFGKLDKSIRNQSGFIKSINNSHYVTIREILDSSICVYTITSIGYFASIFIIIGILLIILFLMLSITTFISARKIADSKTKVIDEIIEAIGNVQNGNLDIFLNINTKDEFQIIAESYNKMLIDIKNLIEVNKEKARQSVLSEIKQLESQFNPHFLFNTLEMIKYMSKMDPASVNKIIVGLSKLLRYSINNTISNVTLGEDLEYTENYLLIQKYRFDKRFDYTIKLEEDVSHCIVPKLIIQPIIENSIKYGFLYSKYLAVEIVAGSIENNLVIVISDNGDGMEPLHLEEIRETLKKSRNDSPHIGLFNVNRRIQLMYGEEYGIEIFSQRHNGTIVRLILPIYRSDINHAESINS